jgi:hypothetical protein
MSTIDELKLVKDGETVAQVCLDIVAFAFTAKAADPGGFLSFYETFRKDFGGELRWWQDGDMKNRRAVDADSLEMMPFWMSDAKTLASPLRGRRSARERGSNDLPTVVGTRGIHSVLGQLSNASWRPLSARSAVGADAAATAIRVQEIRVPSVHHR